MKEDMGDGNFAIMQETKSRMELWDGLDMNVIDNQTGFFGYDSSDVSGWCYRWFGYELC